MEAHEARKAAVSFIEGCHVKSYIYDLRQVSSRQSDGDMTFRATFSRPTRKNPVPLAVVYCTYYVSGTVDSPSVSYRIENETHVHHPGENMSFSEVWLDQILSRKLSVKRFMDTRTPFDISRLDEGKKKEVTEEHFSGSTKSEETKSEETKNEERSDNEDRTNEELFFDEEELQELQQQEIFASEATLVEWFAEADQGRKGFLSSSDFISIVNKRAGDLGLTHDEIAMMLQYADHNADGVIDYSEFVAMGATLLQTLQARRVARAKNDERKDKAYEEAMATLYATEMRSTMDIVNRRLRAADPENTGLLDRSSFYHAVAHRGNLLSRTEINLLLSNVEVEENGSDLVVYSSVPTLLLQIRHQTARHAAFAKGRSELESHLLSECKKRDVSNSGSITVAGLEQILENLADHRLNRLQLYSLLAEAKLEYNSVLGTETTQYEEYVVVAAAALEEMFSEASIRQRAQLMQRGEVVPVELLGGKDREEIETNLMALFQKHDGDGNQVLDRQEFRSCLESAELNLGSNDIAILMNAADTDGNEMIDYHEFVNFSYSILLHLARERALKEMK